VFRVLPAAVGLALALSGCAMRVKGFVTDSLTGEAVDTAGVTVGDNYVHVDSAGHYNIKARFNSKEKFKFFARGYESQYVKMKTAKERYRALDVKLVPKNGNTSAAQPSPKDSPQAQAAAEPAR
jgi:hypothetical protein